MDNSAHKPLSRRIARRLIIALIVVSSTITLIITSYQLYRDYNNDVDLIKLRFNQIESIYVPSLASALWNTDDEDIRLQLTGMLRIADIQYLSVTEAGRLLTEIGDNKQDNTMTRVYPLQYEHRGQVIDIGEFRVVATLDNVYQRLIDKVWIILISNAVKTFLVAGFMLLIFQRLVTRHLYSLAEQVGTLDIENPDKTITLDRRLKRHHHDDDELDVLVNAFEKMRRNALNVINKLRNREVELRLYESIMSSTPDLMAFLDKNYIYRAVNKAYADFFDKQPQDIVGLDVEQLVGSEFFEENVRPRLEKVFRGESIQHVTAMKNTEYKDLFVEVNYYPYYDGQLEVQGVVANIRNVTARIQAERDRQRHMQVYEALAQQGAADLQSFLHDSLSLLQEVYQSRYAFVGRLSGDNSQVNTECVLDGRHRLENFIYNLAGTPCEEVFDHDKVFIYDYVTELYPRDQLLVDMGARTYFGVPLVNTQGVSMGILGVLDTEPHQPDEWHENILSVFGARIALEMERADALRKLELHSEELERQVANRTAELKTSLNDLETFSYSVSHDLRTPLRAINGYSQILLEDNQTNLTEQSVNYLQRIKAASETMGELIDNLLRLSRIGRQPILVETLNITELVHQVFAQKCEDSDRCPELRVQEGMYDDGDVGLVRIALDNLIGNAIKYSAKVTKPMIEVAASRVGVETVYCISDNGVGFDNRYAKKLFEPFQRLHEGSEYQGLGIGLATVKRIFNRHGGRVWAESEPGKGARFYFTLGIKVQMQRQA